MADSIKGITLKILGDTSDLAKSFRQADKEISATQSALRAVDKALKLNPNNVDLVAEKQKLLTTAIKDTETKLEAMKQASKSAMETLGKEGGATEAEIAKLKASIAQTESQLEDYKQQASGAGKETKDMGDSAESAGKEAESAGEKWSKFGDIAKKAVEGAVVAIGAMVAGIAGATKALTDCTVEASAFADEVLTQSSVTGIATDQLQAYMYASELVDVSVDTLTGSMARNIRSMTSAQDGTGATAEAYSQLGVSVTDANGNLRDGETVYWELIDALGQVEDETTRDSLSMSILGKSAQELNPLIEAGSDRMQELAGEAEEAGYIMSGDTLDAFGAFDDNMQKLDVGATAAKNALGGILLPILTDLSGEGVSLLGEFTNKVNEADGDVGQIAGIIGEMLPEVLSIISQYIPVILDLAGQILMALVDSFIANLPQILSVASQILETLAMGLLSALPSLIPTILDVIMGIVSFAEMHIDEILEIAFMIFESLVNGISNNLDKLIPAVVRIINSITTFALSHIDEIIEMALRLMGGIVSGIIMSIPDILSGMGEATSALLGSLGDIGGDIVDLALSWGADLIDNLVSGISGGIQKVKDAVSGVAQSIRDFLGFSEPKSGPLSRFHTFAPDMIDLWDKGVQENLGKVEATMTNFGNVVADGTVPNYSGQLTAINSSIGALGGGKTVIPVYIGNRLLDTVVAEAQANNNMRGGGR